MQRDRIIEFDIMKGIGILAMMIGHRMVSCDALVEGIHTFHMPLFVFISGYLFKIRSFKDLLFRLSKRLLLPFALVCIVFGSFNEPDNAFINALFRSDPPLWVVWFLPALFVVQFLSNWAFQQRWRMIVVFVLSLSSMFLYWQVPLPFYIWQGLFMFPFFALGYFLAQHDAVDYLNSRGTSLLLAVVSLAVWVVSFLVEPRMLRLAVCQANWFLLGDVVISAAACVVVFLLCRMIAGFKCTRNLSSWLVWMGKMSMVMLCLHALDHHLLVGFPWIGAFWTYTSFLGEHAWDVGYLFIEIPLVIGLACMVARIKPLRFVFGLE